MEKCERCVLLEKEVTNLTNGRNNWFDAAMKAEAQRDKIHLDVLGFLSSQGICTPEKGYIAEPFLLRGDLAKLKKAPHERRYVEGQVEMFQDHVPFVISNGALIPPDQL